MAKRPQITLPDHIVLGIDTSFFVTEAPLTVAQQLGVSEADAALGRYWQRHQVMRRSQ